MTVTQLQIFVFGPILRGNYPSLRKIFSKSGVLRTKEKNLKGLVFMHYENHLRYLR